MMQKMIIQLVVESFATQSYPKAMDCLKALRRESIKVCFPGHYTLLMKVCAHMDTYMHLHTFM